jgi:hypothetical protein
MKPCDKAQARRRVAPKNNELAATSAIKSRAITAAITKTKIVVLSICLSL